MLIRTWRRSGETTATTTLIPNLVPKEHLLNGIALNQATQQGSRLVGALAIAPLLGFVNIEAAFWLCSGFYAIGLIQVSRIAIKSTGVIDATQSFARNMVEGFVYVYQRPQILVMVLLVLAHCSFTMSYESIRVPDLDLAFAGLEGFDDRTATGGLHRHHARQRAR